MKEETRKGILELIALFMHPTDTRLPQTNEYGHPFDKEKDPIRGPAVTTITISNSGVEIVTRRSKYSHATGIIGESVFRKTYTWED